MASSLVLRYNKLIQRGSVSAGEEESVLKLEHLKYLLEVNEQGSITQAAEKLYISQPALSGAIKSIENELGYPLFKRSKQGVVPTAKGLQILDDTRKILEITKKWHSPIAIDEQISGQVRFAVVHSVSIAFLLGLFRQLNTQFPLLEIETQEIRNWKMIDFLRAHKEYIGCMVIHEDYMRQIEKTNNLVIKNLLKDDFVLQISAKNPLAKKDIIEKDDLKDSAFVCYANDKDPVQLALCQTYGIGVKYRVNSTAVIPQMIAADLAFSLCPKYAALQEPLLKSGDIVVKEFADFSYPITYSCLYSQDKELLPQEEAFITSMRQYFEALEKTSENF